MVNYDFSDRLLAGLIDKHDSLYRLGGLIGNIRNVDESIAEKFVESLSYIDLSALFSKEDPPAQKEKLSKVAVINFFLSRHVSFTPENAKRIINNIPNVFV